MRELQYICGDCAYILGGKWPKGHVATFHLSICENCKQNTSLAHWSDWNWPKDNDRDANAKEARE